MAAPKHKRIPWEDRFSLPSDAEVVSHYTRQQAALVNAARRSLVRFLGMRGVEGRQVEGQETLRWFGVPWRWAYAYGPRGDGGAGGAGGLLSREDGMIGYVVPSIPNPQVIVTLRLSSLGTLAPKRLTRPMREAITRGTMVGERIWARWELVSKDQIEEISLLLEEIERCEREEAGSGVC